MTFKFNKILGIVEVHADPKFHQTKYSSS